MCTKYIDIVCVLYNVHIYEIFFKFFKYFIARELNKYFCPTLLNLSPWGGGVYMFGFNCVVSTRRAYGNMTSSISEH